MTVHKDVWSKHKLIQTIKYLVFRSLTAHTYFQSLPRVLESSALCRFLWWSESLRRAACAHTMKAFIGRLICRRFFCAASDGRRMAATGGTSAQSKPDNTLATADSTSADSTLFTDILSSVLYTTAFFLSSHTVEVLDLPFGEISVLPDRLAIFAFFRFSNEFTHCKCSQISSLCESCISVSSMCRATNSHHYR